MRNTPAQSLVSQSLASQSIDALQSDVQKPLLAVPGGTIQVKLCGHDTNGAYALLQAHVAPGEWMLPHFHAEEDESVTVVSGVLAIQCGAEHLALQAGDTLFMPRNVVHAITVLPPLPACLLITVTPAGLELFFQELSRQMSEGASEAADLFSLAAEYGVVFPCTFACVPSFPDGETERRLPDVPHIEESSST